MLGGARGSRVRLGGPRRRNEQRSHYARELRRRWLVPAGRRNQHASRVLHRASAHAIHLALGTTWPIQERVLKALFFRSEHEPPRRFVRALNFIAALLFVGCAIFLSMRQLTDPAGWNAVYKYRQLFLQGWLRTVAISIISLGLSLCVGLFLALARRSRFLPLRYCSRIYVELIRGTPLLVQILLLYYGVFHQVGIENRYIAGVLILSGFSGAYLAEIIRAGIESIGKSQLESARAIGLTDRQTFRYVVFPQMIRQVLPPLAGQFASLIKDSSLLSIIALSEFTQNAQNAASYTYSTLESYVPLAVGYLVLTLPISLWTQSLERRHHFDT